MSYNCDVNNITVKDLKMHLMEVGLYEAGMEVQEMRDIVQTLKHSEQSANEEKQYRETITNADKNCEDVMQLLSKSKKEINYNLRKKESCDITTIDDNSNDTNFLPPSDNKDSDKKETPKPETKEIKETPKSPEKQTKNIDVFCPCEVKRKPFKLITSNHTVLQPIYCQPEIRNLPHDFAVKAIQKYHETIAEHYKQVQKKSINLTPWGKPINLPKFSLSKETPKNDDPNDTTEKSIQNTPTNKQNDRYNCVRSRRKIKRKHYSEVSDDDDEDDVISVKKCKESLKPFDEKKRLSTSDHDEMDKIFDDLKNSENFNVSKKSNKTKRDDHNSSDEEPSVVMKVSADIHNDGTNNKKIFTSTPLRNKSKRNINNKSTNNNNIDVIECIDDNPVAPSSTNKRKIIDQLDLVDDNDRVTVTDETISVRRRIVPPNPYKLSQRSEQKLKNLNNRLKKYPCSVSKPESQKNKTNKENEDVEELKEITTKLVTLATKEEEYECPVCNKNFPVSIIQKHASECDKPDKTENVPTTGVCFKCDAFIIHNLEKHLEECQEVVK